MSFQPGAAVYTQGFATRPESVEVPHIDTRAPATTDILYPIGKRWIQTGTAEYVLLGLTSSNGVTSASWVQIADSDGPIETINGTANQINASTSAGTTTLSLPSAITTPGSLTTTTSLATTNGNLSLGTAGNKIVIPTGANASVGTSAAMSGTPGAVTVATTASSATAKIFYSRATTGGTPGEVSITAQDGTGFTLTSTANETSTFNWWIINN